MYVPTLFAAKTQFAYFICKLDIFQKHFENVIVYNFVPSPTIRLDFLSFLLHDSMHDMMKIKVMVNC